MERPSRQEPGDSADDRPRVYRTTGAPASHRRERSSARVNEEKLVAPAAVSASRPHGREALPPVDGGGGGGRRLSVAAAAAATGGDGGHPGEGPASAPRVGGGGGAPSSRRRGSVPSQFDGSDGLASAQHADRPSSSSSSSFRPTSRGSSRVPRGRADSLASAHQAYDGDFPGDAERLQAGGGGPVRGPRSAGGAGGAGGVVDAAGGDQHGWRSGRRASAPAPGNLYEPGASERAPNTTGLPATTEGYYRPGAYYYSSGAPFSSGPEAPSHFASGAEHSGTLADYMHRSLPREQQQQQQQQPQWQGQGQLAPSAEADDPAAASAHPPTPSLPTMVAIVHFGCRAAQGLLAGILLATLLFVSNAGGSTETTAGRVLLAFSAAPGLLPALRFATYVLAALSWLGAGWVYLEYRRARLEAELAGSAATELGSAGGWCLPSVCGASCVCCAGGQASTPAPFAADLQQQQQQQQMQQQAQQAQGPTQVQFGRAQPLSWWGLQQLVGGFTTAGVFLQRHASAFTPPRALNTGGGDAAASGAAAPSAATLASGARAACALAAYCLLMATVWGCMASDSRLHVAAAGIAALAAGGRSAAVAAAVDAYVSDPSLRRHAEAWVALAACRLVCAVTGWLLAASLAASPSGVDQWAAATRGRGPGGSGTVAGQLRAAAAAQQQQQQQQHKGAPTDAYPTDYASTGGAGRPVDCEGGSGGRHRQLLVSSTGYTTTTTTTTAAAAGGSSGSGSWAPAAAASRSAGGDALEFAPR